MGVKIEYREKLAKIESFHRSEERDEWDSRNYESEKMEKQMGYLERERSREKKSPSSLYYDFKERKDRKYPSLEQKKSKIVSDDNENEDRFGSEHLLVKKYFCSLRQAIQTAATITDYFHIPNQLTGKGLQTFIPMSLEQPLQLSPNLWLHSFGYPVLSDSGSSGTISNGLVTRRQLESYLDPQKTTIYYQCCISIKQ